MKNNDRRFGSQCSLSPSRSKNTTDVSSRLTLQWLSKCLRKMQDVWANEKKQWLEVSIDVNLHLPRHESSKMIHLLFSAQHIYVLVIHYHSSIDYWKSSFVFWSPVSVSLHIGAWCDWKLTPIILVQLLGNHPNNHELIEIRSLIHFLLQRGQRLIAPIPILHGHHLLSLVLITNSYDSISIVHSTIHAMSVLVK